MKNKIKTADRKDMKYKHILILSVLMAFLLLCSLSTISAANQTIGADDTGGIGKGINDTGVGDTLFLQPGNYNKTNQDTNLTITKNITIQGNGSTDSVTIDAQGLSRIFAMNNNLNVSFINITFINGYSSSANGGAIFNSYRATQMTFINCIFINNKAPNNQGGAIANSGNYALISGCTFINNTANNRGGAIIDNGGSYVTINDCNFIDNTATSGYGGAVHIAGNPTNITVSGCNFTNNTSGGSGNGGGGICIVAYNSTVIGCNFINNTVINGVGGGLSTGSGHYNLSIIDSNFTGNTAGTSGGGAAISFNATIIGCNFINNNATSSGGGLYILAANFTTISGCNFINNTAKGGSGGGAYIGTATNFTIFECNFINNNATSSGGALLNYASNVLLINSTFTNNNATGSGGAISNQAVSSNLTVISSTFINNTALANGGAIINFASNTTIINSDFINNTAITNGGAISNRGTPNNNYTGNITISNSNFINNIATVSGGVIFNDINMFVSGNTMVGNVAGLGQMIYNTGTVGILNLTFIGNSTWVLNNGSAITLFATLVDDMGNTVTGQNISFYLDGVFFESATSIEGIAKINYSVPSSARDIPVSGEYSGIGTYDILINNGLLQVRIPTNLTVSVPQEVKVGETVTIESKLTDQDGNPIANGAVDFYVDDVKIGSGITDENGIVKINYTFTKAGKLNLTAQFTGNNTYFASEAANQTTVSKIVTITTVKTDKDKITISLTDENGNTLANKTLTVTINGKTYTRTTDSTGQAIINYPNAWNYEVTDNFQEDNKYLGAKNSTAGRTPTKITINIDGDKVIVTLTDNKGKLLEYQTVRIIIDGHEFVGTTDENGQFIISYKNSERFTITAIFDGDDMYIESNTTVPEKPAAHYDGKIVTDNKTNASMKDTGIPVIPTILVILGIPGLGIGRKQN